MRRKPDDLVRQRPDDGTLARVEKRRQRSRALLSFVRKLTSVGLGIAIVLVAMFVYNALNPQTRLTKTDVQGMIASAMASATPPPPLAAQVYEAVAPSIVRINIRSLSEKGVAERGSGTGVILDERGTILTSLHVVKTAIETKVIFADGTESIAMMIASQPEKDIAVLRTFQPPAGLQPATLGNPRFLSVGDEAIVIGNPFGLSYSLSAGAISGLNRTFVPPSGGTPMTGLIQFDAAVNPGNSGGPLLNRYGEVVGIVTGLVNPTGQEVFVGIGFAVPIDVAAAAAGSPPY